MKILGPDLRGRKECEAVLRSLPEWFGIEESLLQYANDSTLLPTFAIATDARIDGFVSLVEHFPVAWEVHCIAVRADARNKGVGRALIAHAEGWLIERGASVLQVKTIAATNPNLYYMQTREFYFRLGFIPLEVFPNLWTPRHPCLQLVKFLRLRRPKD